MTDMIYQPKHYVAEDGTEVRNFISSFDLNFAKGSAVKYITRSSRKGYEMEDLKKAIQCLKFEITQVERREGEAG